MSAAPSVWKLALQLFTLSTIYNYPSNLLDVGYTQQKGRYNPIELGLTWIFFIPKFLPYVVVDDFIIGGDFLNKFEELLPQFIRIHFEEL